MSKARSYKGPLQHPSLQHLPRRQRGLPASPELVAQSRKRGLLFTAALGFGAMLAQVLGLI